jgi:hypothetical protein
MGIEREKIEEATSVLNEAVDILVWLSEWEHVKHSTLMQSDELHGVLMSLFARLPDALDISTKNVLTRLAQQKSGEISGRRWRG